MRIDRVRRLPLAVAIVGALAAGLVIATTAGARTKAAPSVDIWAIAPIGLPAEDVFQTPAGDNVAARYINSHGGLGNLHQKLVVKVCNTQGTPTGELQCGQQATADPNSIAVVEPIVVRNTDAFTAELENHGLPAINPFVNAPSDFVNPINFPLWSPNFALAACAVLTARATHLTTIGFATLTLPINVAEVHSAITATTNAGLKSAGDVELPITSTDLSPFARQLQQMNPQLDAVQFPPFLTGAWLAASQQLGVNVPTCTQDGLTDYQTVAGLGSSLPPFYVAAFLPDVYSKGYPLIDQFRSQALAEVKAGDKQASLAPTSNPQLTLNAWLATQVVAQASANVKGVINRAKFLKALNHSTVRFGTGKQQVLPTINFAKPNSNPKYTRLFNTRIFLKKWNPNTKRYTTVTTVRAALGDQLVP